MSFDQYIPYFLALVGFLLGRILKTFDKVKEDVSLNKEGIVSNSDRLSFLKKSNEDSNKKLSQSMIDLSKEMKDYIKESRSLSQIVGLHDLKIKNLEDQNKFISSELNRRREKRNS